MPWTLAELEVVEKAKTNLKAKVDQAIFSHRLTGLEQEKVTRLEEVAKKYPFQFLNHGPEVIAANIDKVAELVENLYKAACAR